MEEDRCPVCRQLSCTDCYVWAIPTEEETRAMLEKLAEESKQEG